LNIDAGDDDLAGRPDADDSAPRRRPYDAALGKPVATVPGPLMPDVLDRKNARAGVGRSGSGCQGIDRVHQLLDQE
jgi:hypothetical protein